MIENKKQSEADRGSVRHDTKRKILVTSDDQISKLPIAEHRYRINRPKVGREYLAGPQEFNGKEWVLSSRGMTYGTPYEGNEYREIIETYCRLIGEKQGYVSAKDLERLAVKYGREARHISRALQRWHIWRKKYCGPIVCIRFKNCNEAVGFVRERLKRDIELRPFSVKNEKGTGFIGGNIFISDRLAKTKELTGWQILPYRFDFSAKELCYLGSDAEQVYWDIYKTGSFHDRLDLQRFQSLSVERDSTGDITIEKVFA